MPGASPLTLRLAGLLRAFLRRVRPSRTPFLQPALCFGVRSRSAPRLRGPDPAPGVPGLLPFSSFRSAISAATSILRGVLAAGKALAGPHRGGPPAPRHPAPCPLVGCCKAVPHCSHWRQCSAHTDRSVSSVFLVSSVKPVAGFLPADFWESWVHTYISGLQTPYPRVWLFVICLWLSVEK